MRVWVSCGEASIRIGGIYMRALSGKYNGMGTFMEGGMIYDEP